METESESNCPGSSVLTDRPSTHPSDDGGEQLQEGGESVHLPLGDAPGGRLAVVGRSVGVGHVSPQVLVVEHQRVEEVLPGHGAARHALQVVPCDGTHMTSL